MDSNSSSKGEQEVLVNCVHDSWGDLVNSYIQVSRRWNLLSKRGGKNPQRELFDTAFGYFGMLWHEADLTASLFAKLRECLDKHGFAHYEIHVNYILKPQNFKNDRSLYRKITRALRELRTHGLLSKGGLPEIDLIVNNPVESGFLLCLEIKFFHYMLSKHYRDIVDHISHKAHVLEFLRCNNICRLVGILILDDYVCRKLPEISLHTRAFLKTLMERGMISEYRCVTYEELLEAYRDHLAKTSWT